MFSWYKYLIVSLFFSLSCFWSGNLFLIAPFPDLCLLVPLNNSNFAGYTCTYTSLLEKIFGTDNMFRGFSVKYCTLESYVFLG